MHSFSAILHSRFLHSPSFFSLVPGDVDARVILWPVECFRILVHSLGFLAPTFSSVPTVFRIERNLSSLLSLLEHSPHTCGPHHPFSFIPTPSSTYHFPLRIVHTFEL